MNKIRRKALAAIMEQLESIKADLEEVLAEEEETLDNTPESFEERRERMEEAISNMDDVRLLEGWIKQAETRQEFINLIPSVREYKKKDKSVFNMLADLLMYEFKQKGYRYTKSFCYDVIYG